MSAQAESEDRGYDGFYKNFNSPLMRGLRLEAHGKDIGQHSWVTAEELEEDIPRFALSHASRFLDLGCGPGGPLTFITGHVGCHSTGADLSTEAIACARARAASLELDRLIALHQTDLNEPLPFARGSFSAVMSLDVILHLRDRLKFFREVARVLVPKGRFLFTDAGVITGPVSDREVQRRSIYGYTQFVPPGFNESSVQLAGFRLVERQDQTASLLKNASGRREARIAHRAELEALEGNTYYELHQQYLETVIALSQRGSLSRIMYLAESGAV